MLKVNEAELADKSPGVGEKCIVRPAKSATHGRPPSATGGRSKIPTNVHRSLADSQGTDPPEDRGSARRLTSKSFGGAPRRAPSAPSGMQRRQLENQLHVKKNKYATLKKELVEKQKCAIEMYEDVVQLREKLIAAGGKDPGKIDAIQLLCEQNFHAKGGGETFVVDSTVTKEFVSSIESQLEDLSKNLLDVCTDTLGKYDKVLNRLMSHEQRDGDHEAVLELKEYEVDHGNLVMRLEAAKKVEDEFRSSVMSKIAILWSEIDTCRIRIKYLESTGDDVANQLRTKLNSEVEKLRELKERKCTVDGQLHKSKLRIKELEGKVVEDELKISQLQTSIKNFEGQLKQREINFEQKTRDLQKSLKNSEATIAKLESQRDSLESRLVELKGTSSDVLHLEPGDGAVVNREKIESLQKELELVQSELSVYKERSEKLEQEKTEIEGKLKNQLDEKIRELRDLEQNCDKLQKEREVLEKKVKDLEAAPPPCKHTNNEDTGNIIYGSLEAIKLNDDLRKNIVELKRRIKDLESELSQKNTLLQQKERILRDQTKQLKIRDEMIPLLQGKSGNPSTSNKSGKDLVGKASLDELYSTLEDKQMRVVHLEKIVKQMEEQEKRAQEQRTRLEKKIAQLELNLQAKKSENRKIFSIL